MAKPLHLFIHPPYSDWELVHGYGYEDGAPSPREFHHFARLTTKTSGQLFAACKGKLSAHPPATSPFQDPTLPVTIPGMAEPLPKTVTLYLVPNPDSLTDADFQNQAQGIGHLLGFAYQNVETASLEAALGDLLDRTLFGFGETIGRELIIQAFVRGLLRVPVTAGHLIGTAAPTSPPATDRQVGLAVVNRFGTIDPAHVYDRMKDYVQGNEQDLNALLRLVPVGWPVIDANLPLDEIISRTETDLFTMPVLEGLRTDLQLSAAQWRQVGNNQKALWRRRLLQRTGNAPPGSTDPPFVFDNLDWQNLFQLEAVIEFYANYDILLSDSSLRKGEPWGEDARPSDPGDTEYITVDLLNPASTGATVFDRNEATSRTVIQLDGGPDLGRVTLDHDLLWLKEDTARPSKKYRITDVDASANQVTIEGIPVLPASLPGHKWEIVLRPVIVIVDPFGARARRAPGSKGLRLAGTRATLATEPKTVVLDGPPPDLTKVNPHFDTIYLPSDTAPAGRAYRIAAVDDKKKTVKLDEQPVLGDSPSAWHIPAGISGHLEQLTYNLGPGGSDGYDHYDAVLFIVKNGRIQDRAYRWTSFTSRGQNVAEYLSSIRGNRLYKVASFHSTSSSFRNYCFSVQDPGATYDGVREARFYFGKTVQDDSAAPGKDPVDKGPGKTAIRLHRGNYSSKNGSGSAGCLVSINFGSPSGDNFRQKMVKLYQQDYRALHSGNDDPALVPFLTANNAETGTGGALNVPNWTGKLRAMLWLIRPDERPLPV